MILVTDTQLETADIRSERDFAIDVNPRRGVKMNSGKKTYGRRLVEAAVSGISKQKLPAGAKPPVALFLKCLAGAALGTCADTLVRKRSPRLSRTAAYAGVGFLATLAWNTRNIASAMARSAAKEIAKVRDERWLEMNPINYA